MEITETIKIPGFACAEVCVMKEEDAPQNITAHLRSSPFQHAGYARVTI